MDLQPKAFEKLLACLDPNREQAGIRYEQLRRKLVKFFTWRGCGAAEECTDETIDRVSRRLEEGEKIRSSDISHYFYGVARNILKEYWGRRRREKAKHPLLLRRTNSVESGASSREQFDREESQELLECLERCLQELSPEDCQLIRRYYQGEKSTKIVNRQKLASELDLGVNALRIRAHRIRARLEACVEEFRRRRAVRPK